MTLNTRMAGGMTGGSAGDNLRLNFAAAEAARRQKAQDAKDAEVVLKVWEITVDEIGAMNFRAPGDYSQSASVWPEFRKDGSVLVTGRVSGTCRYRVEVFLMAAIRRGQINKAARLAAADMATAAKGGN